MRAMTKRYTSVDEYLGDQPDEIRTKLEGLRAIIKKAAPGATEKISYNIPTYDLNGALVHFAGYKGHIGFYPTASGVAAFQQEIAKYETSKGAIRFPLDKPLPKSLITQIVKFRLLQNLEKPGKKLEKAHKKKLSKGK